MRTLFAWRRLPPPGFIGGAELTEGLLASWMADLGETTFVGSAQDPRNPTNDSMDWLLQCLDDSAIRFDRHGREVRWRWRGVDCRAVPQSELLSIVSRVVDSYDLLWTSQEGCDEIRTLAGSGVAVVTYAHSASQVGVLSYQIGATLVFAASNYVASLANLVRRESVHILRPPIDPCCGQPSRRPADGPILFVNPIPEKGLDRIQRIAKQVDHEFRLVEGWMPGQVNHLDQLGNVIVCPRTTRMHEHFAECSFAIAPSIIPEGAGRVAVEAGLHGRPVIASRVGGLAENVIDSLLLHPDASDQDWIDVFDRLRDSTELWERAAGEQYGLAKANSPTKTDLFTALGSI